MRTLSDSAASALQGLRVEASRHCGQPRGQIALTRTARWALRQCLCQVPARRLPCPCLPLLHGHYPASSLVRRLCHLPGTALRIAHGDHELRRCSRLVIPDSRCFDFSPFPLQPPHALLPRAHCLATESVAEVASFHRQAFGSGLRRFPAGSPVHLAESSSTYFVFADW